MAQPPGQGQSPPELEGRWGDERQTQSRTDGGSGERKASSENASSSGGQSQAGHLRSTAQECSWNPEPLLRPLTSNSSKHDSQQLPRPPLNNPPLILVGFFLFISILHVSGYEEVVRIPKGSVFIHIQELNISLNYLGKLPSLWFSRMVPLFNVSVWK